MVVKLDNLKAAIASKEEAKKAAAKANEKPKATSTAKVTINNVSDVQKYANQITKGYNKTRGLIEDVSIGIIDHMSKHGDYTIVRPLVIAVQSLSNNLFSAWLDWFEDHSWLEVKPALTTISKVKAVKDGDIFARKVNAKTGKPLPKEANVEYLKAATSKRIEKRANGVSEVPNNFWTYKRAKAATSKTEPKVDVRDMAKRFFEKMQNAIDEGSAIDMAIDPDTGKPLAEPMKYAAIRDMLNDYLSKLHPAETKVEVKPANDEEPATPSKVEEKPAKVAAVH